MIPTAIQSPYPHELALLIALVTYISHLIVSLIIRVFNLLLFFLTASASVVSTVCKEMHVCPFMKFSAVVVLYTILAEMAELRITQVKAKRRVLEWLEEDTRLEEETMWEEEEAMLIRRWRGPKGPRGWKYYGSSKYTWEEVGNIERRRNYVYVWR